MDLRKLFGLKPKQHKVKMPFHIIEKHCRQFHNSMSSNFRWRQSYRGLTVQKQIFTIAVKKIDIHRFQIALIQIAPKQQALILYKNDGYQNQEYRNGVWDNALLQLIEEFNQDYLQNNAQARKLKAKKKQDDKIQKITEQFLLYKLEK